MSDENEPQGKPSKPSHIAYQVRQAGEGKSYFNRVGSAFAHGDDKGFNLVLDSMPVDGRVTLRTPQERVNAMKDGASKEGAIKDGNGETRAKGNQDYER